MYLYTRAAFLIIMLFYNPINISTFALREPFDLEGDEDLNGRWANLIIACGIGNIHKIKEQGIPLASHDWDIHSIYSTHSIF